MAIQVGEIGILIKSSIDDATKSVNTLKTSLKDVSQQFSNYPKNISESTKALQTMAGTFNSLKQSMLFTFGFGSLHQSIMTLNKAFVAGFKASSSYIENYNLFNVTMRGSFEQAIEFQNRLNDTFKTNMSETLRYQGFFQNLATSLGITNAASLMLSENLTKLTYDLASLFNISYETAYGKLGSGIVGQTKPLRELGIDVTQQTLQPYLYEMGINKLVTELTQAEKVLLRYIAILDQSTNAQGDFARTIESPVNLMKQFNDQLAETARWFGTIYLNLVGKILPYLNGFVMVLKEIFKWTALAFGFDLSAYDYVAKQDQMLIDFQDELGNTLESSEKLRKSLAGFDELNVIAPEAGDSQMPTIGLTDTYYALLEQLEGYENLMEGVSTRSGQIAENILSWIGFTKIVDEETQEVTYKLEKLNGVAVLIGATLAGLIALPIIGIVTTLAKMVGLTSGFGALTESLKTVSSFVGKAIGVFTSMNPVVIFITVLVALFVAALVDLWNTSESFREKVGRAFETVKEIGISLFEGLKPYIEIFKASLSILWQFGILPLWEGWKSFVAGVSNVMLSLFIFLEPILKFIAWLFGNLMGVISLLAPVVIMLATIFTNSLGRAFDNLGNDLTKLSMWLDKVGTDWRIIWDRISYYFSGVVSNIRNNFYNMVNGVIDMLNWLIRGINLIPGINISEIARIGQTIITSSGVVGGFEGTMAYADGGFPTTGQMFIAREAGAELVGNIGGRTAVVNNTQIVDAVSQGVAKAVSSVLGSGNGGQTVNIYLDDVLVGHSIINSINKATKTTGNTVLAL